MEGIEKTFDLSMTVLEEAHRMARKLKSLKEHSRLYKIDPEPLNTLLESIILFEKSVKKILEEI